MDVERLQRREPAALGLVDVRQEIELVPVDRPRHGQHQLGRQGDGNHDRDEEAR